MTIKELEIQRAEKIIIDKLPPVAQTFVLNSRKVNSLIEKYEKIIMDFMNEDGTVDGKLFNSVLQKKYPKIAEWITIPQYNFYLKDEISTLLQFLFKGAK